MDNKKRISSPDGVSKLMEDMWSRHKAGRKQPENNMFLVDLPPLTEEEKAAIAAEKENSHGSFI